jgi:hypothetical protein
VAFLHRVTWTAAFDRQLRALRKAERRRIMAAAERLDADGLEALKAYPLDRLPEDIPRLAGGLSIWGVDVPGSKGLTMTVLELEDGFRLLTCEAPTR